MSFWPDWKSTASWQQRIPDRVEREYWSNTFDHMYHSKLDAWDYVWTATVWHHGGLTATPNVNLVSNIGFGPDATHTLATVDLPGAPVFSLGELRHPTVIERDDAADRYTFDGHFGGKYIRNPQRASAEQWLRRLRTAIKFPLYYPNKLLNRKT